MWFGVKRAPSERRVYAQSDSKVSSRLEYSFGINDFSEVRIPRPQTWSPSTSHSLNKYSTAPNDSTVSYLSLKNKKFVFLISLFL